MKKRKESIQNDTSIGIRCEDGVIRLFPKPTVIALALQRSLGMDKLTSK